MLDDIWKILYISLSIQEPKIIIIDDNWGFHLYLSKVALNNQFCSK